MEHFRDLDATADACIRAHLLIAEHGTAEMQAVTRVLLVLIGKELARDERTSPRLADVASGQGRRSSNPNVSATDRER